MAALSDGALRPVPHPEGGSYLDTVVVSVRGRKVPLSSMTQALEDEMTKDEFEAYLARIAAAVDERLPRGGAVLDRVMVVVEDQPVSLAEVTRDMEDLMTGKEFEEYYKKVATILHLDEVLGR